jgi:hypothetical protein
MTAVLRSEQQVDSVLCYLAQHGQHLESLELIGMSANSTVIRQLPPNLQLHCLQLTDLSVQLQPGDDAGGILGVLGAATSRANPASQLA